MQSPINFFAVNTYIVKFYSNCTSEGNNFQFSALEIVYFGNNCSLSLQQYWKFWSKEWVLIEAFVKLAEVTKNDQECLLSAFPKYVALIQLWMYQVWWQLDRNHDIYQAS